MTPDEITVEIHEVDGQIMLVEIKGPSFRLELIGEVFLSGRRLHVKKAHIQGASPGAIGRAGLNVIGRKLLSEADVDELVIQGGTRTTGRAQGRTPRPFRFPRRL